MISRSIMLGAGCLAIAVSWLGLILLAAAAALASSAARVSRVEICCGVCLCLWKARVSLGCRLCVCVCVCVCGGGCGSGRVGEWASGRVGEWASGRVGKWASDGDGISNVPWCAVPTRRFASRQRPSVPQQAPGSCPPAPTAALQPRPQVLQHVTPLRPFLSWLCHGAEKNDHVSL
jgi:hypothetical protein